jgi:hypothetical protein
VSSLSVSRSLFFTLSCLAVLLPAAAASGQETPPAAVVLKPVRVELTAGEVRNLRIELDGALEPGLLYKAELPAQEPSRDRVTLGFLDPEVPERPRHGGVPLQGEPVALARQGARLGIRVTAGRCCRGPEIREVELLPQPGARAGKSPVYPVRLPVAISVKPNNRVCGREWISLVVGLVGGALTLYAYGMVVQSQFLSPGDLARRLEAVRREERSTDLQPHSSADVDLLVRRHLTLWRRAWAWLRANPLMFGLPGGAYHETVQLNLDPRVHRSSLSLVPERAFPRLVEKSPERGEGRLYATADRGTRFFAVPRNRQVSGLVLERFRARDDGARLVWLERNERLLRDGSVGWRVHGTGKPR